MTQSTELTVQDYVQSKGFRGQIEQSMPKGADLDRFMRCLFTQFRRVPKLYECSKDSLYSAAIKCSQFGLMPDGHRAHLIPFKGECTVIFDYKGLAELVYRSGQVANIHADKVCENDVFEYNKGKVEAHKIDFKRPRGEPYAYYCTVRFKDGAEKSEVMTKDEVEAIRKRSKGKDSGPWVSDFDEMAKKTVFRRCFKWLPINEELQQVIEEDDKQFDMKNVTPDRNAGPSLEAVTETEAAES